MKYKALGVIFILLAFGALAAGIYNYQTAHQELPPPPVHVDPTANWQSYINTSLGFTIKYPKQYQAEESSYTTNFFPADGQSIAKITIPQETFPKTNFGDATLAVAVNKRLSAAQCLSDTTPLSAPNEPSGLTQTATINGVDFAKSGMFSDVGAGNYYDTIIYRAFHNQICFELATTLHTTNIHNYDPSMGVTAVNENEAWQLLNNVLNTFKFSN